MSRTFATELESARAASDELFALLSPDALYQRPIPERHRLVFYLGHLEAFDWNLVCRTTLDLPSFHSTFDRLFAFGIDPEPGKQSRDQPSDWPSRKEIEDYNRRTRQTIDRVLPDVPALIAQVAIEHRLMHAETLAYLIHNLAYSQKSSPNGRENGHRHAPVDGQMIDVPAGRATLGRPRQSFGWDNEFDEHAAEVPAFRISKYKVTNGDYLKFVREGANAPHFWLRSGDDAWMYRGMFESIALPLDWPVYVMQEEAAAYAKWAGKALPTETQFHRAAYATPDESEREYPWGNALQDIPAQVFDFARWDPASVTATPQADSALGVSQLVGNGWEWTSTPFGPFPGFEPFPFYPGYSKDFFDGAHYVMKGASPRTAGRFLRRSFRNWFRPNYPYVYATFRLVEK
jgi:formylglycine-generating enzyme required for sulfatase activity